MHWQKRSAYGEKMQFRGQIALKLSKAKRELRDIIRKFGLCQNHCKNAKRRKVALANETQSRKSSRNPILLWNLHWQKRQRTEIWFGRPNYISKFAVEASNTIRKLNWIATLQWQKRLEINIIWKPKLYYKFAFGKRDARTNTIWKSWSYWNLQRQKETRWRMQFGGSNQIVLKILQCATRLKSYDDVLRRAARVKLAFWKIKMLFALAKEKWSF